MDPRRAPQGVAAGPLGDAQATPDATASTAVFALAGDEEAPAAATGIARGIAVIRAALRTMPATPGVYRMLDRKGDAVYVGKARNLKSRVQNYAHARDLVEPAAAHGGRDDGDGDRLDPHRGGGAAARMQHDQAADAALQRPVARRQVVSADPYDRRASNFRSSPNIAARKRRTATISGRSPRRARSTAPGDVAKGVSAALVQRQHLCQPHASLPAAPDQAMQRALRRADQPRGLCRH